MALESVATDETDRPKEVCLIADCGQLPALPDASGAGSQVRTPLPAVCPSFLFSFLVFWMGLRWSGSEVESVRGT